MRISLLFEKKLREVILDPTIFLFCLEKCMRDLEDVTRCTFPAISDCVRINGNLRFGRDPQGRDAVILTIRAFRRGERKPLQVWRRGYTIPEPAPRLRLAASY